MANLKKVAKAITNRETLTPEHGQIIQKGVQERATKMEKAKQAKKEAAKPAAKKTVKKGK